MNSRKIISSILSLSVFISFVCCDISVAAVNDRGGKSILFSENLSVCVQSDIKNTNTLIVNIMDLHGDAQVQKKIVEIIGFYDKINKIEKIFVEGGMEGKIEDGVFDKFDEDAKRKIADIMLENAAISAGQYYCLTNGRDILCGIEDPYLYNLNLKLIPEMVKTGKEYADFFGEIDFALGKLKKSFLKKENAVIFDAVDICDKTSYAKVVRYFGGDASFDKSKYGEFLKLLRVTASPRGAEFKQIPQLLKYLQKTASYKDYNHIASALNKMSANNNAQNPYSFILEKFPETAKLFPEAMLVLEQYYLLEKLNAYEAQSQKDNLKKYIINRRLSAAEKEIFLIEKNIKNIQNAYALNISRREAETILSDNEAFFGVFEKYFPKKYANTLRLLHNNKIAKKIYENNLKRDAVFSEAVKKQIGLEKEITAKKENSLEKIYIVITGGFHSRFPEILSVNGISCITIAPKVFKKQHRINYVENIISFYGDNSFAEPVIHNVNKNSDSPLTRIFLKNILLAWLESELSSGVEEKDAFEKINAWLRRNPEFGDIAKFLPENKNKTRGKQKVNIWKILKSFMQKAEKAHLGKQWLSLPLLFAGGNSYGNIKTAGDLKKYFLSSDFQEPDGAVFSVSQQDGFLSAEISEGFRMPFGETARLLKNTGYAGPTILKFKNLPEKKILDELDGYAMRFLIISGDPEYISGNRGLYKNLEFIFDIRQYSGNIEYMAEIIKKASGSGAVSFYVDDKIFNEYGAYLLNGDKGAKAALYIEPEDGKEYNDFIVESKNKIVFISQNPARDVLKKKNALTASNNIKAVPFMLLVGGLELFTSFSTIFLQGQGYSLSFISLVFAVCGPFYILGSLAAGFASKYIGKTNIIIAGLVLHCLGDALLLLSGLSPVIVIMALGIPSFAAAGVSTLLVPFLQSSLKMINKTDKFEKVYGETRSVFWLCLALSSVAGSFLAGIIGQMPVIALSSVIISLFTLYVIKTAKTFTAGQISEEEKNQERTYSELKEYRKVFEGIKTVFTTKGLNSLVILNMIVDNIVFGVLSVGIQSMLMGCGIPISWLGVIMFLVNTTQSFAGKIAAKASSAVTDRTNRFIYFAFLFALSCAVVVFNNPVMIIVLFVLVNFWQGISSVTEPSLAARHLSAGTSAYWFSFKIISTTAISTLMHLAIAALLRTLGVNSLLVFSFAAALSASLLPGSVSKSQHNNMSAEKINFNTGMMKNLLSAA